MTALGYKIAARNYDALVALLNRMTEDDLAWDTINARVEEARQAMRGMPDNMITLGELHTAYRCVFDNGPVSTKRVGTSIQSSDVRAGNALRQLEDAELVTDANGEWIATHNDLSPEEANAVFDAKFPGLTTITTKRPSGTSKQPRAERTSQQGGSTMSTKATAEFTQDKTKQSGTKYDQVVKMIDTLRKSDDPIGFTDLCNKVGAKYPQDVQAAMFALESVGIITRWTYAEEGSTRSRIAYKWARDEEDGETPRPTKRTSRSSTKRSSASKKTDEAPATEEATPAAA